MSTISNQIVQKTFQRAPSKPACWLHIFVLDASEFQNIHSGGLSAINSEINTLEQLTPDSIEGLSGLGLKGGALSVLKSIAAAISREPSPRETPTPSPVSSSSNSLTYPMSTPTHNKPQTLGDCESLLEDALRAFFLVADQFSQFSSLPRMQSEKVLFELRMACTDAVEKFKASHSSSRSKRPRESSKSPVNNQ